MQTEKHTTWVEVSKKALQHNVLQFKKVLGDEKKIMAVVKSNAYGHGMIGTASALQGHVDYFAVVSVEEALDLRKNGIENDILVFSILGFDLSSLVESINKDIELTIFDAVSYEKVVEASIAAGRKAVVHIKVDTGMSRLGFNVQDSFDIIKKTFSDEHLEIKGVFSHLSSADEDIDFTDLQCKRFQKFLDFLQENNLEVQVKHILNTAAVMMGQDIGNTVRIGLGLYGLAPSDFVFDIIKKRHPWFELVPSLAWKTRIIQVKEVSEGSFVSYGKTFQSDKNIKLAVIPVGYWDGLGRKLSNTGDVLINTQRCRIRGRVCMNHTMVDVSDLDNVKVGDEVVLIGKSGSEEITADELTKKIGTINYGIVTRINPLLSRIYC